MSCSNLAGRMSCDWRWVERGTGVLPVKVRVDEESFDVEALLGAVDCVEVEFTDGREKLGAPFQFPKPVI